MAGKRDSRRHSTKSFSENVVVAGTSYQILEVKSFCDRGRAKPPIKITALIFQVKNSTMKFPGWILVVEEGPVTPVLCGFN